VNLAEQLLGAGNENAVALRCGDDELTYGGLRRAVAQAAGAWRRAGLRVDDRVMVFAPDSIEWVQAYLGAIWAGGVAIGVNPRLGMAELAPIVGESEPAFIWCESDLAPQIATMVATLPAPPRLVVARLSGEGGDWKGALASASPVESLDRGEADPALWIGTSGTTGAPKGVVHAHRLVHGCDAFARHVLGVSSRDRLYATSKLFFAYALGNSLLAGLRRGATVILDREWPTPQRVREMVGRYRPTVLFSVPTLYQKMLLEPGLTAFLAGADVHNYVSAGEALPAGVRAGWLAHTGKAPISGYGTSETLCLMLYCDDDTRLAQPTPLTEVRYADRIAADVPQRIWVRAPTVALGYWRRPAEQAESFADGWYSPGDVFLRHRDDRLEFAGRNDDMLKISGQWVSTLWIEQALTQACGDAIEQIAAIGVPGADGLTAISLLVVPAAAREDEARQRLTAGIEQLPKYRRPRWIHWLSELPLTATGKLQRGRLKALHEKQVTG
jgi:acyl-coenzyme A synthetase/AMP-(fatty) acid ligase